MQVVVAEKIAEALAQLGSRITLIWHGGEPTSVGLPFMRELTEPFEALRQKGFIQHGIQTNATLINQNWCEFFRQHQFSIGVSIDGPQWANQHRVNWSGVESYQKTMNGINCLKEAKIPFTSICVVTAESATRPEEIYDFFCDLGCTSLGINFEEKEAANQSNLDNKELVMDFWRRFLFRWRQNPKIQIRQIRRIIQQLSSLLQSGDTNTERELDKINIFPTISYAGDVILLSPELLGGKSEQYDNFVVGNVSQESLLEILSRWADIHYVKDYLEGVRNCKESCQYFQICGGGQASNKFFEHGTVIATETVFCKNIYQYPAEVLINSI